MVLDFDLDTFCQNLKATKPPYECPFDNCGKIYKSYSGIQFHLLNFDHDTGALDTPGKSSRKGSGTASNQPHHRSLQQDGSPPGLARSSRPEPLSYAESQRMVEVDFDGKIRRINIFEPLDIITQDEMDNCDNIEKENHPEKQKAAKDGVKSGKEEPKVDVKKLPQAMFRVIDDYVRPPRLPARPTSYYKYIERTPDEMDEEVEYDMDEEDFAWLELINENRKKENVAAVSQGVFEMLMDRFEKEAFFQSQSTGGDACPPIDEDAVCAICMDGECQNSNVILFCDMCNLAVHQECYGVPYIPEGQWLCRRCIQSPSCAVRCCLCPNKGGAFKQTDDNRWAHVVCALWIPEVAFANIVFLEPIDNVARIPAARWKLSCYICKQRGTGACIQCHKTNCYTAFHVTCAQQAGLYMKIEPVRECGIKGTTINVRKTAFCDVHCPPDGSWQPMMDNGIESDEDQPASITPAEVKAQNRIKMRRARKILAEKRNATPIVSIPVIPEEKVAHIAGQISLAKKAMFVQRLQSYWALKRQSRNGVPLLRRLQASHMKAREQKQQTEEGVDKTEQISQDALQEGGKNVKEAQTAESCGTVPCVPREDNQENNMAGTTNDVAKTPLCKNGQKSETKLDEVDCVKEDFEATEKNEFDVEGDKPKKSKVICKTPKSERKSKLKKDKKSIGDPRAGDKESVALKAQLKYWQRLRQDLEKARLLVELIRKREKLKREEMRVHVMMREMQLQPLIKLLRETLDKLEELDTQSIFAKPVNLKEVPDYGKVIVTPMDFSTMRSKLEGHQYTSVTQFSADFDLTIYNCMKYNAKDTVFYRAAVKLRDKGGVVIRNARRMAERVGYDPDTGLHCPNSPKVIEPDPMILDDVDSLLNSKQREHIPLEEQLNLLLDRLDMANAAYGYHRKPKLAKLLKREISKVRAQLALQKGNSPVMSETEDTCNDTDTHDEGTTSAGSRSPSLSKRVLGRSVSPPARTSPARKGGRGRGRGRGRGGRNVGRPTHHTDNTPVKSDDEGTGESLESTVPSTPSGVNRRTAVLLSSKKARTPRQTHAPSTDNPSTATTTTSRRGRPPKIKATQHNIAATSETLTESADGDKIDSRKRSTSSSSGPSLTDNEPAAKRPPVNPPCLGIADSPGVFKKKESFLSYRNNKLHVTSDVDSTSGGDGSESELSDSDSSSDGSSSDSDDGPPNGPRQKRDPQRPFHREIHKKTLPTVPEQDEKPSPMLPPKKQARIFQFFPQIPKSRTPGPASQSAPSEGEGEFVLPETGADGSLLPSPVRGHKRCNSWSSTEDGDISASLEPLDLVWAKCRGYPWYPALLINPKMPRTGYLHNGVPIPVPPEEVLTIQNKYKVDVYLVLFFDNKRTWQWLPRNKLEPLGVDMVRDKIKLTETRKPNVRKAVKTAYERAILHRCRVTGEPNPLQAQDSDQEDES